MKTLQTDLDYSSLRFFSKLIKDYLRKDENIIPLFSQNADIQGFENIINLREKKPINRELLVEVLKKQYSGVEKTTSSLENITALIDTNTFTVTTGHQLNLFTGPLYFIYKIISTLNLSIRLKKEFPNYNFVPIYWMATEDHDFAEINHFRNRQNTIRWENSSGGAVGDLALEQVDEPFESFVSSVGNSKNARLLKKWFEQTYLNHSDLSSATRYLVHELFGKYGLVILDANDTKLKRDFIPHFLKEIKEQVCNKEVTKTNSYLKANGYKIQVNPRAINLFYLQTNSRERILKEGDFYVVKNTNKKLTYTEIVKEINDFPERFSPNVLMRPLYQEAILPNLAYIGGAGEIAYWLQLKSYFESSKVSFPILILRNSVVWIKNKEVKKLDKLGISMAELFLKPDDLIKSFIKKSTHPKIDFIPFEAQLRDLYKQIETLAACTDITFVVTTKAQAQRQVNELYKLEKRLIKAQKIKKSGAIDRLQMIQNELFPDGNLQERIANFSTLYEIMGEVFFSELFDKLDPLKPEFTILIN